MFFDEPALVTWRRGQGLLDREAAIDVLSGSLAAIEGVSGVHVCGDGDVGLALQAGPQVLGVEVSEELTRDTVALARSSTATVGSRGERSPQIVPLVNRPTHTGDVWPRCGAS